MTRQQKIAKGKLWQVYPDKDYDNILHEGSRTSCFAYLKANKQFRDYKSGAIRLSKVVWENANPNTANSSKK